MVEPREGKDVLAEGLGVSTLRLGHSATPLDLAVALFQWGATLGEGPHLHAVKGRADGPRRLRLSLRKHERRKVHVLWMARWWTLTRLALQARFEADPRPRAGGLHVDRECGSRIDEASPELEDDVGRP